MPDVMCPKCQSAMVWHEGAISKKSGKRYNGFWGCSNYPKCTETFKPNTPTPAEESFSRSLEQDKQQERIDKAIKEKKENIKWLNALNNATYLIARHDKFRILDEVEIKKKIHVSANWYYSLNPLTEDKELENIGDQV